MVTGAVLGCGATPQRAEPRSRRIVVVGAGLSGLAIAYALHKQGREVLVLEAQARVGGRIRTIRGFRNDLHVEAGAAHLLGDNVNALLEELAVPLVDAPRRPRLAEVSVLRGERRIIEPGDDAPAQIEMSAEDAALGEDGRRAKYLRVAASIDPDALAWPAEIAALDQVSMGAFLRGQGASPGVIADANATFPLGDGIETVSALAVLRELASLDLEIRRAREAPPTGKRAGPRRIAGGMDSLPRALAARLGDRVVLRTEVVRIAHRHDGATLTVSDAGGTHTLDAAAVILTMPFPVLRRIEVSPAWSALKARAIAELEMSPVTRVWLEADTRFWNDEGLSGRAETDLAIGTINHETDQLGTPGGVLGMYAAQGRARHFAALAPDARIAAMLAGCEPVFPGLMQHVIHGDSVAWEHEPFARGGYAWWKPGQLTELLAAAIAPEGVVHFAGDGTSARPGWMRGALASATRVLGELEARG
ncbi:MAG: FAD-dependent oxidoreductase [Kofleriaceae bacterium]